MEVSLLYVSPVVVQRSSQESLEKPEGSDREQDDQEGSLFLLILITEGDLDMQQIGGKQEADKPTNASKEDLERCVEAAVQGVVES